MIAKISKTIENLTSKKTQVVSRDVQTSSDPRHWDKISELLSELDGIQGEVAEYSNTEQ